MEQIKKPHLSISQIHSYLRCPMIHYWRNVEKKVVPPTSNLVMGRSADSVLSYNYSQKINSHVDISKDDFLDYFGSKFDEEAKIAEFEIGEIPGELKDYGINTLKEYHASVSPLHQPIEDGIQKTIDLSLPEASFDFKMVIDMIDTDNRVIDFKTSKKSYSKVDKDDNTKGYKVPFEARNQLSAYKIGYKILFGKEPDMSLIELCVFNKQSSVIIQPVETDTASFHRIFNHVANCIKNKIYYPNPIYNMCPFSKSSNPDEKGCGYFKFCREAEVL